MLDGTFRIRNVLGFIGMYYDDIKEFIDELLKLRDGETLEKEYVTVDGNKVFLSARRDNCNATIKIYFGGCEDEIVVNLYY